MGRPPGDLDDYLDWQERLESYKASGLAVDVFCLQEGVSRSTFYRWADRLKDGVPESMVAEKAARQRAESGEAAFVPITLKASPVEIELPNGGIVRLPLGVGQVVLVEVIRAVGALKPWKASVGRSAGGESAAAKAKGKATCSIWTRLRPTSRQAPRRGTKEPKSKAIAVASGARSIGISCGRSAMNTISRIKRRSVRAVAARWTASVKT